MLCITLISYHFELTQHPHYIELPTNSQGAPRALSRHSKGTPKDFYTHKRAIVLWFHRITEFLEAE